MQFTYPAYRELLKQLQDHGYDFSTYHNYEKSDRCVILRHDIDNCIEAAIPMGRIEAECGAPSTFFVLLTSDFYNPASQKSLTLLRQLQAMGHEIGLHFDEVAYGETDIPVETLIRREADILADILGTPVTSVSMHRPSKKTLESDLQIPDLVNSYGKTFFHDFKYLSDSRCRWREPVMDIVQSEEYTRLHILTHAIWYHDEAQGIEETVKNFILRANRERYMQMMHNITDLNSIVSEDIL